MMKRTLCLLLSAVLLSSMCHAQAYRTVRTFPCGNTATQGIAVDDNYFYGISNAQITKYTKTGDSLATWREKDPQLIRHFDGGIIVDGLLYCSHSNFPEVPMASSIEVFDPVRMEHVKTVSLGIEYGSCTWVVPGDGCWYVCFAHYDRNGEKAGDTVYYTNDPKRQAASVAMYTKQGLDVAVNYKGSEEAAASLVKELEALGVQARAFKADVSERAQVEALFKEVNEAMGRSIEVLVNNAGITRDTLLMRMEPEDWDAVLATNLNATFYCTREALRAMAKARWGRVVNVASVVGLIGNAGQANYAASKAGIIGFTKSVAREYAARGVTANAVAPGFIETDMTGVLKEDVWSAILGQIPLGRMGSPEDVARAAAFFVRDESSYITGQVLAVDGGMTMC